MSENQSTVEATKAAESRPAGDGAAAPATPATPGPSLLRRALALVPSGRRVRVIVLVGLPVVAAVLAAGILLPGGRSDRRPESPGTARPSAETAPAAETAEPAAVGSASGPEAGAHDRMRDSVEAALAAGDLDAAVSLLGEAVPRVGDENPALLLRLFLRLSVALEAAGRSATARLYAEAAARLTTSVGAPVRTIELLAAAVENGDVVAARRRLYETLLITDDIAEGDVAAATAHAMARIAESFFREWHGAASPAVDIDAVEITFDVP